MNAMPTTDIQAALIGSSVALPDGRVATVCREDVTGEPSFVRNRIREHANDGTLLRKETGLRTWHTPAGARAACTVIVLRPAELPTTRQARPVLRWTLTGAGVACGIFGIAGVIGFATADEFAVFLQALLAGVGLCALGGLLIAVAGRIGGSTGGGGGHVCTGHHCLGCPDY